MPARPEKYHHGNLRQALLKAAFQLAGKMETFTLREVARRAGVSHNAPYRHFQSKEDLIAALAAESLRQLHEVLREAVAGSGSPADRLEAAARAYLKFAFKNRTRFNLMFHSTFDRHAYPEYVEAYTGSLELVLGLIHSDGNLNTDPETAAELVWAAIHGIAELGLAGRLRFGNVEELDRLASTAVRTVLAGIRTPLSAEIRS